MVETGQPGHSLQQRPVKRAGTQGSDRTSPPPAESIPGPTLHMVRLCSRTSHLLKH